MSSFRDDLALSLPGGHKHTCAACGMTRVCYEVFFGRECDYSEEEHGPYVCGLCAIFFTPEEIEAGEPRKALEK